MVKIDFDSLIQVMLKELDRQYPNDITAALKATKIIYSDDIKEHSKTWFALLCASIAIVDDN